mmetsp:Transcript_25622/g.78824  ORF Transcript_25622/g.78824 Transcript_25622/m.78824 type:complete len:206 (-) Transcript_25622:161-778(-)
MKLLLLTGVVATALVATRAPVRGVRRQATRAVVKMEDFGLLKGTKFSFGEEWKGQEVLSEVAVEKYMNSKGLRYKMNKTDKERAGLKLLDFKPIQFSIPFINVNVDIAPPQVESIWEALGFTATSNNAARQAEKKRAIKAELEAEEKYKDLLTFWKDKYGYQKYVPGTWFYADQLSTDDEELKSTSGFRMRKGGYYLDGTKDTRK